MPRDRLVLSARFSAVVAAALLTASCAAVAQPSTAPGRYVATAANERITIRDTSTNTVIMSPHGREFVSGTGCQAETVMTPVENGIDVVVTYRNPTSAPKVIGECLVGSFRLGGLVTARDFKFDARTVTLDARATGTAQGPDASWPSVLYSPVAVFGNDRHTVGVSIMYPVLTYKHEIIVCLRAKAGTGGPNWEVATHIGASLPPGGVRTYRYAVRIVDSTDNWVRTLLPYREFFQQTYGAVRYQRDSRPVSGMNFSDFPTQSGSNPWGFVGPQNWRPDVHGWSGFAQHIRQRPARNYGRVMLWKLTGVYANSSGGTTFPFRFMTRMNDFASMRNTLGELRSLPSPALQVGYWWGSSTQVDRGWSPQGMEAFDVNNPDHVQRGFAELDMALSVNADVIGLDAFGYNIPRWEAHAWLTMMQNRAPAVKFITENALPDIFHVLAPTYVYSSDVATPKVLADFLVPGHETWAGMSFHLLHERLGRPPTDADKRAELDRVSALGYVPVIFDDYAIAANEYFAERSWLSTIPADLRSDQSGGGSPIAPPTQPGLMLAPPATGGGGGGGGGGGVGGGGWGGGGGKLSFGAASGAGSGSSVTTFRGGSPALARHAAGIFSPEEIRLALHRAKQKVSAPPAPEEPELEPIEEE